ncbi:16S rRNA (adenine(1518)-N(6)/adenine(1519)-N(6))-dimethyltransferase RsmA [Spiroplasma endosymbiont of Polydrusus pterygomalis]|uniref:16S rRNA (adenine(1518)-N(6)/adenine(1519)-N(6))- dimethyltransferase RsmA n=1 Tax=Spiroplasma endosymbiont of Polydrusus pterygomalis TaxID=3139327 RepID=UPI003CCA8559
MENPKKILKKYDLHAVKKFGQNFLVNNNIIDKIVKTANLKDKDGVIEIGAGIGHLTNKLVNVTQKVVTIEIDKKLIPVLQSELKAYQNLKIINEDFLTLNLKKIISEEFKINQKIHVVANLPYYITSQIVLKLLENIEMFDSLTLMIQKEVAQRFCAKPKTKIYNNLSVMCQFYCDVKIAFDVSPHNFTPTPNVTSSVIYFKVNPKFQLDEPQLFWNFVRNCFFNKRKTLINNLSIYLNNKEKAVNVINDLSWSLTIRSEELTFAMFYQLFNLIKIK